MIKAQKINNPKYYCPFTEKWSIGRGGWEVVLIHNEDNYWESLYTVWGEGWNEYTGKADNIFKLDCCNSVEYGK